MIQLRVITGSAEGQRYEGDQFPITVGRNPGCSFVLSDPGVFDRHFEIQFSPDGFRLQASPHAVVAINGDNAEKALLRNGDVIGAGYAKIQFWLGAMAQRGLRVREVLTWLMVIAVGIAQAYLLSRLLDLSRS